MKLDQEYEYEIVGELVFFSAPWVHGLRTHKHFGPVVHEAFIACGDELEKARGEVREVLRSEVLRLGGNALLGYEERIDPFAQEGEDMGTRIEARGQAVSLVAVF